jgi:hypothetical protein
MLTDFSGKRVVCIPLKFCAGGKVFLSVLEGKIKTMKIKCDI